MSVESGPFLLLLLPLFPQHSPFLFLPSQLLHLLTAFVFNFLLLQLLASNSKHQFLAVLLLLRNRSLVNRDESVEFCDAVVEFSVFIFDSDQTFIQIGFFSEETPNVTLSLETFLAYQVILSSHCPIFSSIFFDFLPELTNLNSRSFFFNFENFSKTFLFLQFYFGLCDFIFFFV